MKKNNETAARNKEWMRTSAFLISLLVVICVYPFLGESHAGQLIASTLVLLTLAGGVAAMFSHRHAFWITLSLVGGSVIVEILPYVFHEDFFRSITYLRSFLVYGFFAVLLFYYLLKVEHLSMVEIGNAISIYLLVGLSFANLYCFIVQFYPEALHYAGSLKKEPRNDLIYYSFVTLTTTGYGDIYPAMKITRLLANIESIFGVFFIAVIIGRMVGIGRKKDHAKK